jgi:Protein phosphatase 2C
MSVSESKLLAVTSQKTASTSNYVCVDIGFGVVVVVVVVVCFWPACVDVVWVLHSSCVFTLPFICSNLLTFRFISWYACIVLYCRCVLYICVCVCVFPCSMRSAVSRAFGDLDYKGHKHEFFPELALTEDLVIATAEISRTRIVPEDKFMILACDGLWDVMSNQEAVDFCRALLNNKWGIFKKRQAVRKKVGQLLRQNEDLKSRAIKRKLAIAFPEIKFGNKVWQAYVDWVHDAATGDLLGGDPHISVDTFVEPLNRPPTPHELAGYLVREALIRGSTDNVSVLLIHFHWV